MTYWLTMALRTFAAETRGNVAMLVAFSLIPLMGAGAIAVDYTYAETMKVKLAAAADSAALAGAQLFNGTAKQRSDRAAATFESSLSQLQGVKKVKFEASDVTDKGVYTGFKVEATAEAETIFAKIIGIDKLKIGVSAESVLGDGSKMEIALVLDTTGSMAGAKMDNLKLAANGLVKTLSEKALVAGSMKFSLVPFAQYVNVGLANRNQSWISVPSDTSVAKTGCWKESPIISKNNCKIVKQTYLNDGVPVTYDQEVCDITYGPEVEVCGSWTETSVWNGCAGSRNYPLNKQDGGYGTPVPGLPNQSCPAALTPLTANTSVITAGINAMYAAGETYIPGGLIWGWRTLSPQAPFSESEKGKSGSKVNQYIILMTDGANTITPAYPYHNNDGGDPAVANGLTSEICQAIRNDNIKVYAIAYEVTDVTIKGILQGCAKESANFFDASNAAQLADAFAAIGNSISALRLRK